MTEAEYECDHRGERVALARKRQARKGEYGGGVRPYGWGVDTGRVRSVCVNPKAPAMERRYEDRPVLDMTRHSPAEAAEIRRWADDLLAGVSMNQVLRDLAARGVPTVAVTDGRVVRRDGKPAEHAGVELPDHPADPDQPRAPRGTWSTRGRSSPATLTSPILPDDIRAGDDHPVRRPGAQDVAGQHAPGGWGR